jgi:hypothetical protein
MNQLAVILSCVRDNLSTFGLSIDVLGVAMLFIWPPPAEPIFKSGADIIVFSREEDMEENRKLWRSQLSKARVALGTVFVGFVLQLAGQLWPPN